MILEWVERWQNESFSGGDETQQLKGACYCIWTVWKCLSKIDDCRVHETEFVKMKVGEEIAVFKYVHKQTRVGGGFCYGHCLLYWSVIVAGIKEWENCVMFVSCTHTLFPIVALITESILDIPDL